MHLPNAEVHPEVRMRNDEAYDNRGHIPDAESYIARWEAEARAFRDARSAMDRAELGLPYGSHPRQAFDLFRPDSAAEGVVVFVHGGYWRLFDRSFWSHFAEGALAHGWAVAMPSYPLCPEVRIADITRSAAAAIDAAAERVQGPLALTGHSAGGHLVARMACADAGLAPDVLGRVRAIAPISPVTDLRPLIDTSMNSDLALDNDGARAESPALMPKVLDVPVQVWVGGAERPAFLDQARWLADAWPGTSMHVVAGRHHFDVIDALRDPESEMVRSLLG